MIEREKLTGETPLFVFLEYLKQHYPDKYPLAEELTEFKRGKTAGTIEMQRFIDDVCRPKKD